jgi:sRNA-binding protein
MLHLDLDFNGTGSHMAKPNYAFAKRQRDLAKKRKKEEKRQRKAQAQEQPTPDDTLPPPVDETTVK